TRFARTTHPGTRHWSKNMTFRKLTPILLLAGLLLTACGASTATPTGNAPPVVSDDFAVIADGRLLPRQSVQLSFSAGGKVAELLVAEGARVAQGEVIARLENSEALQAEVSRAELELLNAQQALSDLKDSAAMVTAQAAFAFAQAQDALAKAQKDLKSIQSPASQALHDVVADSKLALDTAQANLQLANVSPDAQALEQAIVATDIAFRNYQHWQAEYDKSNNSQELFDIKEQARAAYQAALDQQLALQLTIDTAKANQANAVGKAQERYDDAVANLNAALRGPDADKLALAQAKEALAQATLADAQAKYAKVQSGPDPAQLQLAEARLAAAQTTLAAAQSALENAELRAPFAGSIGKLDLKVGEQVAPGQPVATLADFSSWVIETDNLTEIEVVKITQGQGVTVKLDALPDLPLRGQVESIGNVFEEKRGDITYTVRIALADADPQLRWGMTAEVTFDK
ncbi:MAG: HlyD family secretion protein, partial [Anaerolineales bacterium]